MQRRWVQPGPGLAWTTGPADCEVLRYPDALSGRCAANNKQTNKQTTRARNERLAHLIDVVSATTEQFGSVYAVVKWHQTAPDYMNNGREVAPLTLGATDADAHIVESVLQQTARGIL